MIDWVVRADLKCIGKKRMVVVVYNLCTMVMAPTNLLFRVVQEKCPDHLLEIFTFYIDVLMMSSESFQGGPI